MKTLKLCCLALLCSFTFLSLARGELIPYQIEGIITLSQDPNNPSNPFPGVSVGDSWTANFTVDTSVSDLDPQDPSLGSYPMASSFHLTMGSVNRNYSDYLISVIPNFSLSYDSVVIRAPTVVSGSPDWVALELDYVIGTFNGSDSIPPLSNMSDFLPSLNNLAFIQGSTNYIQGEVSSITAVPEPATLLLVGSGLAGLVGLRRKFKV